MAVKETGKGAPPAASPRGKRSPAADIETVDVIGLPVAVVDYDRAAQAIIDFALAGDRAYGISAANTHVTAHARHDAEYGAALHKFDLICPDGMPLVWSVNDRLPEDRKLRDRVYGPTMMLRTLEKSAGNPEVRHFLLGGAETTLAKLEKRMEKDFSDATLAGVYSPPFGTWPEDEFERICEKIRACRANVVWVGLGAPKQELWIGDHLEELPPAAYLAVGAAFAFHAGEVPQAPMMFQRMGMEWLYRLVMEPRRLWKRYLVYNSLFVKSSLAERIWGGDAGAVEVELPRETAPTVDNLPDRCNVLGVGVSAMNLEQAARLIVEGADQEGHAGYVTVTGVHGVMESRRDPDLRRIHNRSFLSTPDGMPMVWLGRMHGHESMGRVYGPDLMLEVINATVGSGRGHFFWGGKEGLAAELAERMLAWFPGTEVAGASCPPFRALEESEEQELVEELRKSKPHLMWVGLGTPKQEIFMHGFLARHPDLTKDWDHGLIMLGVGAAFDFHTGEVDQAPRWMQHKGLEWFFRLCMEPRRLWKRYSINNTGFIFAIIAQLMGWKKYPIEK
jgi:N-acetylglucosaminyldiphosphoundecaprenol N-acetyl-beta-D-mannosaminyltransferase